MNYASLIQPVLWAATLGTFTAALGAAAWNKKKGKSKKLLLKVAATAAATAALIVPMIGVVPAGYRGVVYEWNGGVNQAERGEGITVLAPWIQHMQTISVRTQKVFSNKVYSQSADLQEITAVVSVNFHVEPDMAAWLYQKVGLQYQSTVIQPALFQRTKAAIGRVKAEDFALSRGPLARTIQKHLTRQLAPYGIVVEFVNIEDAIFDPAFVKAVKNKIIAEQKAKEEHNLIAAKEAVKAQTIIAAQALARSVLIEATAQAKANRKLSASLTGDLLRWRWIVTWNGNLPATLVGSGNQPFLLGLPSP